MANGLLGCRLGWRFFLSVFVRRRKLHALEGLAPNQVDVDADEEDEEGEDPSQGIREANRDEGLVAYRIGSIDEPWHELGADDPPDEFADAGQEGEKRLPDALEVIPTDEEQAQRKYMHESTIM